MGKLSLFLIGLAIMAFAYFMSDGSVSGMSDGTTLIIFLSGLLILILGVFWTKKNESLHYRR